MCDETCDKKPTDAELLQAIREGKPFKVWIYPNIYRWNDDRDRFEIQTVSGWQQANPDLGFFLMQNRVELAPSADTKEVTAPEICETCRWWALECYSEDKQDMHECRGNGLVFAHDDYRWPHTNPTEWCRHYGRRTE